MFKILLDHFTQTVLFVTNWKRPCQSDHWSAIRWQSRLDLTGLVVSLKIAVTMWLSYSLTNLAANGNLNPCHMSKLAGYLCTDPPNWCGMWLGQALNSPWLCTANCLSSVFVCLGFTQTGQGVPNGSHLHTPNSLAALFKVLMKFCKFVFVNCANHNQGNRICMDVKALDRAWT